MTAACGNGSSTGERVCTMVPVSGGVVTSDDDVLTIALRPDALDEDTEVCIQKTNEPPSVFGDAYRVTPDIELNVSANITYRHEIPSDTDGVAIGIILREEFESGAGRWLALPVTRLEPENNLIGGNDPRLSMFYALLDDGGSGMVETGTTSTTTDTTTTMTMSGSPTSMTATMTTTDPTSTATTADTDATTTGPTTGSTGGSESTGTTGGGFDCQNMYDGPYTTEDLGVIFPSGGNEDIAMDGAGGIIGPSGADVLRYDGVGTSTFYSPLDNPGRGLRFHSNGDLIVTNVIADTIQAISGGSLVLYNDGADIGGYTLPNGLYVDSTGDAWLTDFVNDAVYRINDGGATVDLIVPNQNQANGVFYDEDRSRLYWTLFGDSQLWTVDIDAGGNPGTESLVVDLPGQTDGVAMDSCGHLYVTDNGNATPCRIDRVFLDAAGDLDTTMGVSGVEEIARGGDVGDDCSNVQFGYGFGDDWDASIFVTFDTGTLYRVFVGIDGSVIPFPP